MTRVASQEERESKKSKTCKFQSKPPTETTPLRGKASSMVSSLITSITGHTTRVGSSAIRSRRGSNQPEGHQTGDGGREGERGRGRELAKREMVVDPKTPKPSRRGCVQKALTGTLSKMTC